MRRRIHSKSKTGIVTYESTIIHRDRLPTRVIQQTGGGGEGDEWGCCVATTVNDNQYVCEGELEVENKEVRERALSQPKQELCLCVEVQIHVDKDIYPCPHEEGEQRG